MIFIIIAAILGSVAISTLKNNFTPKNVNPFFLEFYTDLYSDIHSQISSEKLKKLQELSIQMIPEAEDSKIMKFYFGDRSIILNKNVIGFCIYPENTIYMREISIKNQNKEHIQSIIDHETGHCVFGRNHSFGYIETNGLNIPKSLMVTGMSKYYEGNKQFYRHELITNKNDLILKLHQKEQELRNEGTPLDQMPTELKKYEIILDR